MDTYAVGDIASAALPAQYRAGRSRPQSRSRPLETQRRALSTQRSAVLVAGNQSRRAAVNRKLAAHTVERLRPLADEAYVPRQQLDQAETTARGAVTAVAQLSEQQAATARAVDTEAAGQAAVKARESSLALARRARYHRAGDPGWSCCRAECEAGRTGRALSVSLQLVATDEWFAMANFRETELRAVGVTDPVFDVARELEHIALNDPYFVEKKLYPNIDFYSGIILSAIGFPTTMFTVLFALARTVGWVAQWNEMITDPAQKIGRPRQLYVGPTQRDYVPVGQR